MSCLIKTTVTPNAQKRLQHFRVLPLASPHLVCPKGSRERKGKNDSSFYLSEGPGTQQDDRAS